MTELWKMLTEQRKAERKAMKIIHHLNEIDKYGDDTSRNEINSIKKIIERG